MTTPAIPLRRCDVDLLGVLSGAGGGIMGTGRLEAFSDGVFAVAITLLILNIQVPHLSPGQDLAVVLGSQWPSYVAYILSFITVGITWINHHQMFKMIQNADHTLLVLNLLLLMAITFIPFPTALLAEYLRDPTQQRTAVLVYGGLFTTSAVLFNLTWWYAASQKLIDPTIDPALLRSMAVRYLPGPVLYLISTLAAFISVGLGVVLFILMNLFYLLPNTLFSGKNVRGPQE